MYKRLEEAYQILINYRFGYIHPGNLFLLLQLASLQIGKRGTHMPHILHQHLSDYIFDVYRDSRGIFG